MVIARVPSRTKEQRTGRTSVSRFTCVVAFTCLMVVAGCDKADRVRVVGSGNIVTEKPQVKSFDKIALAGAFRVDVTVGDTASVTITTDDNIQPLIETTIQDGALLLRLTEKVKPTNSVDVKIVAPSLMKFTCDGAAKATIHDVRGPSFLVELRGAAHLDVTGEVDSLTLHIDGAGRIQAGELHADKVDVVVRGAGKIDTHAITKLNVLLEGLGFVQYSGDPEITKSINGLGTISKK